MNVNLSTLLAIVIVALSTVASNSKANGITGPASTSVERFVQEAKSTPIATKHILKERSIVRDTVLGTEYVLLTKLTYEARPVGGILSVQVSTLPTFFGVGVTLRTVRHAELAEAIDELRSEDLNAKLRHLTKNVIEEKTFASLR